MSRARATSLSEAEAIPAGSEDNWLHVAPGKAWQPVLTLWIYSALLGALVIGFGQLAVWMTRPLLPEAAVRLGATIVAVVAAGIGGDYVLSVLKRRFDW